MLLYNDLNWDALEENQASFRRLWLTLTLRNSRAALAHQLKVSDLAWDPSTGSFPKATAQRGLDHRQKDSGLRTTPLLPSANALLNSVLLTTGLRWAFWRPALLLYLTIAVVFVVRYRNRRPRGSCSRCRWPCNPPRCSSRTCRRTSRTSTPAISLA